MIKVIGVRFRTGWKDLLLFARKAEDQPWTTM